MADRTLAHGSASDDGPQGATARPALRLVDGRLVPVDELVAEESPLALYVDGEELVTLVASPADLEELVVGFLTSEAIVSGPAQIRWTAIDPVAGEAWVVTVDGSGRRARERFLRHPAIASCCGRTRPTAYFQSDLDVVGRTRRPGRGPTLDVATARDLVRTLEAHTRASLFGATGGVHSALLARADGSVVAVRSDIGRHNALDKLYGHTLLAGTDTARTVVAFSGRISSEVVLKVAKIGSAIVLSKSAPTTLALDLAAQLGMTAVGFVRDDRLTVYTGPERIVQGGAGETGPDRA